MPSRAGATAVYRACHWNPRLIRTLTLERIRVFRLPDDWTRWFLALLFAGLAVQTARLLWAILMPAGPLGDWRPAMPLRMSTGAQSAIFSSVSAFNSSALGAASASLPNDLKLFGVRGAFGALQGGAIIQLPDDQQVSVSVGEPVMPGVDLVAVGFDFADVVRQGGRQRLFLDQDKAPESPPQGDASTATRPSPGPTDLRAAVSLSPRASGRGISGVIVMPGSNAAEFARTGLRAGDVIVAVNGTPIAAAEDLIQLQKSLSATGSLSLRIERAGSVVPVTLSPASAR